MSETMLRVEGLFDPGGFDVESLEALDGRELAELFKRLDQVRRRAEGALAAVIGVVDDRGVHRGDGHNSVNGWCRALGRWSDTECRERIRTANLIASCDRFRTAVMSGEIGVAQSHELGRVFSNPRVGTQLVDVAGVMVDNATKLSHHEFRITMRRWEMLADLDGAHKSAEAAHEGRRAGIVEVGEEIHLNARGGLAQGAVMVEIFERFCDAEFSADWEQTVTRFGEAACYSLMPRNDAQRRFDAIYAIFERAAAMHPDAHRRGAAGQRDDRHRDPRVLPGRDRRHHSARRSSSAALRNGVGNPGPNIRCCSGDDLGAGPPGRGRLGRGGDQHGTPQPAVHRQRPPSNPAPIQPLRRRRLRHTDPPLPSRPHDRMVPTRNHRRTQRRTNVRTTQPIEEHRLPSPPRPEGFWHTYRPDGTEIC